MIISQSIKDKLKNIVKNKNVNFNVLLREYMYERFIERLSVSKYKFNFILKGGYYLSTLFGIENRSTMDIDACLKDSELSIENLLNIVNEIISIDINDGAIFIVDNISQIRDEDEYGGYRVSLTVKIDNMKESFHLDVATGDLITPSEIVYEYKSVIDDKKISVLAYNLETVLAEKLETILTRGEKNSRMKDFLDIYLIMSVKEEYINLDYLNQAVKNTFTKRNFNGDIGEIFNSLRESNIFESKWNNYIKRKGILDVSFQQVLNSVEQLIDEILVTI